MKEKIKKIEHGYADINEQYFIYEFEKWCVYKKTEQGKLSFIWSFNTLKEAKSFVEKKL